jgi:hypothetical protein
MTATSAIPQCNDWHRNGIYLVLDAEGKPLFETASETAYSARATLARDGNMRWSCAVERGFSMVKLLPVAAVKATADNAASIEVIQIKPTGKVRGVASVTLPFRGRDFVLANATMLVGAPSDITAHLPGRMTPEELQYLTGALALFAEELQAI